MRHVMVGDLEPCEAVGLAQPDAKDMGGRRQMFQPRIGPLVDQIAGTVEDHDGAVVQFDRHIMARRGDAVEIDRVADKALG